MSDQPWAPERVVGPELALALIRGQFPALGVDRVQPLGAGWDNTAYLAGDIVFRFPRRASTVPLLEREIRVLPLLAPHLPLPIPVPEWVGEPTEEYPWRFAGYRRLPGRPISGQPLTDEQLEAAAVALGDFLAALHALPPAALELPGDEIGRLAFGDRLPLLRQRLLALAQKALIADAAPWLALVEAAPLPTGRRVPVHGDLYTEHLLADSAGRIRAVIDWGDVHAGDPAVDLSFVFSLLPPAARGKFLERHGAVDEATLRLARARAVFHSTALTNFAAETGDERLLGAGLAALKRTLEE